VRTGDGDTGDGGGSFGGGGGDGDSANDVTITAVVVCETRPYCVGANTPVSCKFDIPSSAAAAASASS
jgi:hypothetical protein